MLELPPDTLKQISIINNRCEVLKPKVVIFSLVYNHSEYLDEYFEGIIKQKTDFPFVAIIHDDASTDESVSIISKYAAKYPDIFMPIFESTNLYQQNIKLINLIMVRAIEATKAQYVAFCEGDDYWISETKLQLQVDFLDSHPEYGVTHTKVQEIYWEDNYDKYKTIELNAPNGNVYPVILKRNFIYTLTVVFRNSLLGAFKKEILPTICLDRIMWICFSKYTKFHYIPQVTGRYRVSKQSATHGNNKFIYNADLANCNLIITFMKMNHYSQTDINIFYLERCRRLLKYSYMAKEFGQSRTYWSEINKLGEPKFADSLIRLIMLLRISPTFIDKIKFYKKRLNRIFNS